MEKQKDDENAKEKRKMEREQMRIEKEEKAIRKKDKSNPINNILVAVKHMGNEMNILDEQMICEVNVL